MSDGGPVVAPKYLLLYTVWHHPEYGFSIDPCMAEGSCWEAQAYKPFAELQDAIAWINGKPNLYGRSLPKDSTVVGLYRVESVPLKQVRVGTTKKQVTKTVEEDAPVMEWRAK